MSYRRYIPLLCLFVQTATAQTFSVEGSVEVERLDGLNNKQTTFAARYHFQPVSTEQGPLE